MRRRNLLGALSALVVSCTAYALILPAITASAPTYCGLDEHAHTAECYAGELVCGYDEGDAQTVVITPGHSHDTHCYAPDGTLICDELECQPVTEERGHVHTDACYAETLVCSRPRHSHTELCFSDPDGAETSETWESTLPLADRSGVWAEDLVLIAKSQVGVRESDRTFTVTDGVRKGYTRYGDWYGDPYGDWCAMFISFCLHYADIPSSSVPYGAQMAPWAELLAQQGLYHGRTDDDYLPRSGDIVCFDRDGDGEPDDAGIVQGLQGQGKQAKLIVIAGDTDDKVARFSCAADAEDVHGFAALPERPAGSEPSPGSEENHITDREGRLLFTGEDYEITLSYGADAGIGADARLSVRELARESEEYAAHQTAAAAELAEDQRLTYARFFDIRITDADGRELQPADGRSVQVEIRLAETPGLGANESVGVVRFAEGGAELLEPDRTWLSPAAELESVRFTADGFSVWGVVQAKALRAQLLTAEGKGVAITVRADAGAEIPDGATLQVRELRSGSREFLQYRDRAAQLLSGDGQEAAALTFARFFDLTILDAAGRALEPAEPVSVEIVYEDRMELQLGQTMHVVHFADSGVELIEPDLRWSDEDGDQAAEGTALSFDQGSFSVTGTVLTGDEISHNGDIHDGFPTENANYVVTFDAVVNGVTRTYAMGYGGVVTAVTRNPDGTVSIQDAVSLGDEWLESFIWYYRNWRRTNLGGLGSTEGSADGNFLTNEKPFATAPNGGYRGGIASLPVNTIKNNKIRIGNTTYTDLRNRVYHSRTLGINKYWDHTNYDYIEDDSGLPAQGGNAVSGPLTPQFGPMGGFTTCVYESSSSYWDLKDICYYNIGSGSAEYGVTRRLERSLYIDNNGYVRLSMQYSCNQSTKHLTPVKEQSNDLLSGTYARCDAILVYDDNAWKWVYPYQVGAGREYPNAVKATNLQFANGFTNDGLEPAQPGKPFAVVDGYKLDAPEIGKTLMPNNGGDGTYSLALSVMGDSHAYRSDVVADVLLVADMSTSMTTVEAGGKTRLQILKDALGVLNNTLMSQNDASKTVVNMNMIYFGSDAYGYGRSWVNSESGFQSYIDTFNNLPADLLGGTNWEDALGLAKQVLDERKAAVANDGKQHAFYLLFLTDGDPTLWLAPTESAPSGGYHNDEWNYFLSGNVYGTGAEDPQNIYYSLREAMDEAREIVWGVSDGYADAQNETHVDAETGETDQLDVYLYGINTMGSADTLTNLLAYAYNGSLEATYPEDTFIMANNEQELRSTFRSIANAISSTAAYSSVSIFDPVTEYTHLAPEMDWSSGSGFHYYKYRSDHDGNIFDPGNPVAVEPRYTAVKNANGVVTHYLDTYNGNAVVTNIYEHLPVWDDLTVTVPDYTDGTPPRVERTLEPAVFDIAIRRSADEAAVDLADLLAASGCASADDPAFEHWVNANVGNAKSDNKPYYYYQYIQWDLQLTEPITDPTGQSSTEFALEADWTYAVTTTVWPYQGIYEAVAKLNNGLITLEELAQQIDIRYLHYDGTTGLYSYDTNTRDETGRSQATVNYRRYDTYYDESTGEWSVSRTDPGWQHFINPDSMPLTDTTIRVRKEWKDSLDETLLEHLIEAAVNEKLIDMGLGSLSDLTPARIRGLSDEQRQTLRKAFATEIVTLHKWIDEDFPSEDANLYDPDSEGRFSLYRIGCDDPDAPGYITDDPSAPDYPNYPGHSGSVPWALNLYPEWHFYGERPGETESYHNGHIVVDNDGAAEQEISLGVGLMISEGNARFDPTANTYGIPTMELTLPDGTTGTYYILEEGRDYTLREANRDPSFRLQTRVYHPFLVDGVLYNVEYSGSGTTLTGTALAEDANDGRLSKLIAENRLRPQLTLGKQILNGAYQEQYQKLPNGDVKTYSAAFRGDSNRTVDYPMRPEGAFTVHVEIAIDPAITPVLDCSRVCYVRYPAYLDQMAAEGVISREELDAYIACELGHGSAVYEIDGVLYGNGSGVKQGGFTAFTPAAGNSQTGYTLLTADIPLTANQRARVFNVPENATVHVVETNVPSSYSLSHYSMEWTDEARTSFLAYASGDTLAALRSANWHGGAFDAGTLTDYPLLDSQGFSLQVEALDINYSATVYNLVRSVDLELKKIDALTVRRDTVTLTDQTTPAGSGQMYDDAAVPGLSGAGFTLYQRVEEVPVSDMAALGLLWLKSDGTTATGAKPSADCIQVSRAKNSAGQPVSVSNGGLTDAQGRLRFYSLLPGTYYLVETRAPDGYPLANPTGGTGGCCITVNLTDSGVTYLQPDFNAGAAQTALSRTETAAPTVTVYEMLIQNGRGGAELPQTGGMGSRWSTVMGLALIVGAGALLIRRKNRRGVG